MASDSALGLRRAHRMGEKIGWVAEVEGGGYSGWKNVCNSEMPAEETWKKLLGKKALCKMVDEK